jgi:uncharacterized membrane protein YraQ (UPF0718 family)
VSEVTAIAWFVGREVAGVLPAFALSVALGVLIRALRLDGMIRRAVEARVGLAVVLATVVGAFSPLCSCTVIPVVSGLLVSGVPLAPVMSFWVASPTMDPEMFALTVATLGWPLAVVRLAATLVLSLGAGYATLALQRAGHLTANVLRPALIRPALSKGRLLVVQAAGAPGIAPAIAGGSDGARAAGCCGPAASAPDRAATSWRGQLAARLAAVHWPTVARETAAQGYRLGRWLVLAFILEAVILRHVPQAAIAGVLGEGSAFAVVLAALVGIPLYLNNVSALPIVSGLLAQGMQPGAAIAFLIAGPVTTVPAMSAVWGVVRPPVFALYVAVALVGAVVLGALTNVLLG